MRFLFFFLLLLSFSLVSALPSDLEPIPETPPVLSIPVPELPPQVAAAAGGGGGNVTAPTVADANVTAEEVPDTVPAEDVVLPSSPAFAADDLSLPVDAPDDVGVSFEGDDVLPLPVRSSSFPWWALIVVVLFVLAGVVWFLRRDGGLPERLRKF